MVQLEFATDNAAFDAGNRNSEIVRIVRLLADRIESCLTEGQGAQWLVYDSNGNRIGRLELSEREQD